MEMISDTLLIFLYDFVNISILWPSFVCFVNANIDKIHNNRNIIVPNQLLVYVLVYYVLYWCKILCVRATLYICILSPINRNIEKIQNNIHVRNTKLMNMYLLGSRATPKRKYFVHRVFLATWIRDQATKLHRWFTACILQVPGVV